MHSVYMLGRGGGNMLQNPIQKTKSSLFIDLITLQAVLIVQIFFYIYRANAFISLKKIKITDLPLHIKCQF